MYVTMATNTLIKNHKINFITKYQTYLNHQQQEFDIK